MRLPVINASLESLSRSISSASYRLENNEMSDQARHELERKRELWTEARDDLEAMRDHAEA